MKIRQNFVANSSSSSYCIIGYEFNSIEDFLNVLRKSNMTLPIYKLENVKDFLWEIEDFIADAFGDDIDFYRLCEYSKRFVLGKQIDISCDIDQLQKNIESISKDIPTLSGKSKKLIGLYSSYDEAYMMIGDD